MIETKTRQIAASQNVDESVDNHWLEAAVLAEDEEINVSQISYGDFDHESNGSQMAYEDVEMFDSNEFDELEKLD